jgi:hypothetical protein
MPKPGVCVIVAGFQNIEDKAPPAATPAKASPCPTVLCSRKPNAPAFASIAAIGMRTAALASNAAQPDLTVLAPIVRPPPAVASFGDDSSPRPRFADIRSTIQGETGHRRNGLS